MSFSLIVESRHLQASQSKFCEWRRLQIGQGYRTPWCIILGVRILWVHRQQSTWCDRTPLAEEWSEQTNTDGLCSHSPVLPLAWLLYCSSICPNKR